MWLYVSVFVSALAVDLIPVIAPPAWMLMLYLMVRFDLNPWIVLPVGVLGSTLGRYLMSLYIRRFTRRFMQHGKREDLKFLGKKLSQKSWKSPLFVFLYTVTPLSSTGLFVASGIARVKPMRILPAFFCGKFLSDAVMLFYGRYAVADFQGILHGTFSVKGMMTIVLGLVVLGGFLVIDWRSLLERKQFRFNFKVWK